MTAPEVPLPEGAVLLGPPDAITKNPFQMFKGWKRLPGEPGWTKGEFYGDDPRGIYAAPADSEVARLNAPAPAVSTEVGKRDHNCAICDGPAVLEGQTCPACHSKPAPDAVTEGEGPESSVPKLRAMAHNYREGHSWDHLDAEVCQSAADEIERLKFACNTDAATAEHLLEERSRLRSELAAANAERDKANATIERLSGALEDYRNRCLDCGGAGWYMREINGEPEQEQCQWCDAAHVALTPKQDGRAG